MSFEMTILIFIEADYCLLIFEMSRGDASQIEGIGRLYTRVSQKKVASRMLLEPRCTRYYPCY